MPDDPGDKAVVPTDAVARVRTGGSEEAYRKAEDLLIGRAFVVADKAFAQLEERLDAEKLNNRDLTILAGVATDKIAEKRRWEKQTGNEGANASDRLAAAMGSLLERLDGKKLTLSLEPAEPDPEPERDVTPKSADGD